MQWFKFSKVVFVVYINTMIRRHSFLNFISHGYTIHNTHTQYTVHNTQYTIHIETKRSYQLTDSLGFLEKL